MSEKLHFDLGITCAGGGTGGAYIAGVLDYFFETLDKWEKAKKAKCPGIPMHTVKISVMGGNSAGSISTALSVLNLYKNGNNYIPITEPKDELTGNLLYDSWVLLNEIGGGDILKELLKTSDLDDAKSFVSLLNNKAIDDIAEHTHRHFQEGRFSLPDHFVTEDFEFIISMANLKGVPYKIKFKSDDSPEINDKNSKDHQDPIDRNKGWWPSHVIHQHKLIAYFRPQHGMTSQASSAIQFSPTSIKDRKLLLECAKSSGTLPFIFKARLFSSEDFPENYLKDVVDKFTLLDRQQKDESSKLVQPQKTGERYSFFTVDGGTFNNEPFGEVNYLLNKKEPTEVRQILIDPYPNFSNKNEHEILTKQKIKDKHAPPAREMSVFQLFAPLIKAFRGQSMFKSHELLTEYDERVLSGKHLKGMIFPSNSLFKDESDFLFNRPVVEKKKIKLASAPLGGLAGFVSKDFRKRDFFLGRYNCQIFLRRFFYISSKQTDHKLHKIYNQDVKLPNGKKILLKDLFRIKEDAERAGQQFARLPIIPDMRYYDHALESGQVLESTEKELSIYDYGSPYTPEYATVLKMTRKCFIHEKELNSYHKPLKARIKKMIKYGISDLLTSFSKNKGKSSDKKFPLKSVRSYFLIIMAFLLLAPALIFILPLYFVFIGRLPLNALSDKILNIIKIEFDKVGMLKKEAKEPIHLKLIQNVILFFGVLCLLCVAFMVVDLKNNPLLEGINKNMIVALEFAKSNADAKNILNSWNLTANRSVVGLRNALVYQTKIDFFFLFFYSSLFGLLSYYFAKIQPLGKRWKNRLFLLLSLTLTGTILLGDLVENTQLLQVLNSSADLKTYKVLNFFTWMKWESIGLIFLTFAVFIFRKNNLKRIAASSLLLIPFVLMIFLLFELKINDGQVGYFDQSPSKLQPTTGLKLVKYYISSIFFLLFSLYTYTIYEKFLQKKQIG